MPATSLASLITGLVASMESAAAGLREHHLAQQAVRRLVRQAESDGTAGLPPDAPVLAGSRPLREECPEQASGDECGAAIDHPVADRACAVR